MTIPKAKESSKEAEENEWSLEGKKSKEEIEKEEDPRQQVIPGTGGW
jgi:hypothetical protein